jgi:hypothetical protein
MSTRDQEQADALGKNRLAGERSRHDIRETLGQERMAGIYVIVQDLNVGMFAAELREDLAEGFPLPKVPIERGRQDENFTGPSRGFLAEGSIKRLFTRIFAGVHNERGKAYARREAQNSSDRLAERTGLRLRTGPVRLARQQIARENE